jgi:acyl-coenzyme A thioesterase PaaI-like protein
MNGPDDELLRFPTESGCFGCSTNNEAGLQLTFRRREGGISSSYTIPDRFHGAPGIAHGGIVASIFDEVSCATIFFLKNRHVVTGELLVRYLQPCPVETPLEFHALVVEDTHSRYAVVDARAHKGVVLLARSSGKFFYVDRPVSAP